MHSSDGTNHFYGQCQRADFEARYERSSENKTRSAHNEIVASFVAGNGPAGPTIIFRNSIAAITLLSIGRANAFSFKRRSAKWDGFNAATFKLAAEE
jgi:hypothetical protein